MFKTTTHLSKILEDSETRSVIIFKYSSVCGSSERLAMELKEKMAKDKIKAHIYQVTVQTEPILSRKISEWFKIKHETPQIIILNKGRVTYTAHHGNIDLEKFVFN